ncbi:GH3 auxin-responsive promoter family protein [Paracrocinitomix mangrovi]|uniref:GH3 auxin-responsive promoter family protein n=1 Tax=Paracrocinitomix mangrovi TaxID=2862509 RepID=UPI001C8DFF67|nr:GH3 auxin-responsive promoter family protein [Paracrocinitomix mangrovi]UKN00936.1 GH3 auxin-responsive promoter family protein [Paracrocinitomix mangrovi]
MPFNSIFSWIIKKRIHQIELFKKYPFEVQRDVFNYLIQNAKDTEWGVKYGYNKIKSYKDFSKQVPLSDYPLLQPYIERMLKNEQNLLWNEDILWFAKSSGTTTGKSKFLPVSKSALEDCHYKGGKDLLSLYYNQLPDRKLYKGKHLIIGGSAEITNLDGDSYFGDLSAIILKNMPWWAEIRRTPSKEIALMSNWEEKIEKLAQTTKDEDIYILAGVPSWTLVLCNRVLEITGKKHLREVWPNLELFMHGGVSFDPYKEQFRKLIPFDDMNYVETYNASEGFFGIQDDFKIDELLLMLDYGIFFEFIPMSDFNGVDSKTVVPLEEVELGKNYALVISSNGGLWRYIIGDTIRFTSKSPYRFKITGRTKSFINAFGEELVVENAEVAMAAACQKTNAHISNYTAAPIFMENGEGGGHEWLIEFITLPDDLEAFTHILDGELKSVNSDYEAKRAGNLSLQMPRIQIASKGLFEAWLKKSDKLGGQHKIPRLNNDRILIDELLAMNLVEG